MFRNYPQPCCPVCNHVAPRHVKKTDLGAGYFSSADSSRTLHVYRCKCGVSFTYSEAKPSSGVEAAY